MESNTSLSDAINQANANPFDDVSDYRDDTSTTVNEQVGANAPFLDYGVNQINAPEVWNQNITGKDIIVAVIDDGVDYNHFDLDDNIWKNTKEKPGNKVDDDGNGFIDDYNGFDFGDDDSNPTGSAEDSHGTHVAGSIAAERNGSGIVGVAPDATIMPIRAIAGKITSREWVDIAEAISKAIDYAVDNGAKVINMSLGFDQGKGDDNIKRQGRFETVNKALENAKDKGVVVVMAAGNEWGSKPDSSFGIAARDKLGIAVGAVSKDLKVASFSNRAGNFDPYPYVTAPGVAIYSAGPSGYPGESPNVVKDSDQNGLFYESQGTSMATPHVAGVVALMLQANPNLTPDQVATILTQTATSTGLSV